MDDFLNWLQSEDGQLTEQTIFEVQDSLQDCTVVPKERLIIWNKKRLTIDEVANRIHKQSGLPFEKVETHVIGWLELHYEPKGLDEQQMEEFEEQITSWTDAYKQEKGLDLY